jgi:uracil phosphoribosyltransferase
LTDQRLTVVEHPLIQHKLGYLRDKETPTVHFRKLANEITLLLTYEATKDMPTEPAEIDTPLERMTAQRISGKKVAVCPVLRAGVGMLDGVLSLVSSARVGFVGLYRDEKEAGAQSVTLVCIVGAPPGVEEVHRQHPDVHIVCAAVDRGLNERGFIVPGLGDAGDRLYGTK